MNDIFDFRKKLIDRYRSFSTSFANPRSADISTVVRQAYDKGTIWPDPLIQINPNYKKGSRIDALVSDGSVEPETAEIFQVGKQDDPPAPKPITLYKHQMNALAFVASNKSYVVTTGTGSGKSLTFFIPIDARYAKLYGLNEEELTYILDPSAVYGPDYPSESFRVLKEKEIAEFGEYRTMRMVLEAFRKDFH